MKLSATTAAGLTVVVMFVGAVGVPEGSVGAALISAYGVLLAGRALMVSAGNGLAAWRSQGWEPREMADLVGYVALGRDGAVYVTRRGWRAVRLFELEGHVQGSGTCLL